MQFIQGSNRHQTYFATLDDQVAVYNPVRLMDAFIDKLELSKLGFSKTVHKSEGRPPYAPAVLLKLYLYGYLNKIRSSRKLEKECLRNIELQWLLHQLQPNYHTIADFRKMHALPLQHMFRLYVQFLSDAGLLGKTTIAVDGSKFKAVNSRKNNYNQKKIDKHQQFIADKTAKYLQELDELDSQENTSSDDLQIKKEKIALGMAKLNERTIKYDTLQQQLDNTTDKQIGTTDPDSRSIIIVKNIVEVAYNVQNAVDDKHNLIVQRSEFQEAVDHNNNIIKQKPQYYKRRQAIVEHPFGTIKRNWGYTHTLLKDLQKVNGEMNLIMLCYNFLPTTNILGLDKMLLAINNWKPDYKKAIGTFKMTIQKSSYRQNASLIFLSTKRFGYLMAG